MLKNKKSLLMIVTLMVFTFLVGCTQDHKSPVKNVKPKEQKIESNNNKEKEKQDKIETKNKEKKQFAQETNVSKIEKEEVKNKNFEGQINIKWKENKKYLATIEGKEDMAEQEGIGKIYLKENDKNKLWLLKINEMKNQDSPKFLEWIDDENLLVIIGHAYGTISKGGNLYCINVKNDTIVSVYEAKDNKHEVMSVEKVKDNLAEVSLILKLNVYEDDNFIKSHIEKITISSDKVKKFIK